MKKVTTAPIMVPTDFTKPAEQAIRFAIRLAEKSGQRIILFHVCYFSEVKNSAALLYPEAVKQSLINAQEKLNQIIQQFTKHSTSHTSVVFESHVFFGEDKAKEIISAAKRKKTGLIVMGTHGATGLKKLLSGSIASQVIRRCAVPVLIIPSEHKISSPSKLIYFTDLQQTREEWKKITQLSTLFELSSETVFIDVGWATTQKEISSINFLQKSGEPFHHEHVRIEMPLIDHIHTVMKKKSPAIACLFHKKKSRLAGIFGGNISPDLAQELNFPLLIVPKRDH